MASESTIGTEGRPLRIAIAGGGSGGHVSPAVAVVQRLRQNVPLDAIWIGARDEFEGAAAAQLEVNFHRIRAGKLRRYLSIETIGDGVRVPIGAVQAWCILRRFRPDVVVSTGGFVSVPSVIAAWALRIPALTHEQTAGTGLATRINARFSDTVALSFEQSRASLGSTRGRVVITGNPVRQFVQNGDARRALASFNLQGDRPLVYITGGAQGARSINAAIDGILPNLLDDAEVIHQCGSRTAHDDYDKLLRRAASLDPLHKQRYRVCQRIGQELGDIYAAASLVVGRSGAGTVAELSAVGLPAIFVPLPGADEQRQNALLLVEAGAAVMIEQSDLSPRTLLSTVTRLLAHPEKLQAMGAAARTITTGDAAERLVYEILLLARRGESLD